MSDAKTNDQLLADDLATLRDRFADEESSFDLYRALAGNELSKAVWPDTSR